MSRLCKAAVSAATEARALISELRQLDERCGTIIGHCKELIDAVLEEIVSTLVAGEDVSFRGFGKLAVRHKRERLQLNLKTGAAAPLAGLSPARHRKP